MPDPQDKRIDGAAPSHLHIEKRRTNWLAWLALAFGPLALLFALGRCNRHEDVVTTTNTASTSEVIGATPGADRSTVPAGTSDLGAFLAATGRHRAASPSNG